MTIRRQRPPLWVLLVAAIAFAASAAVASAGSDAGPLRETRPAGRCPATTETTRSGGHDDWAV